MGKKDTKKATPGNDNTQADYVMFDIFMSPISQDDVDNQHVDGHITIPIDDKHYILMKSDVFVKGLGRYVFQQLLSSKSMVGIADCDCWVWDFGDT